MASYREEYYSHVDELFDKLKDPPFSKPIMDQTEYEISRPGSIQPVGWVRNASGDGVKSVEINIDGLAFWTSGGQRTLLSPSSDWGEIEQQNIDGSNDIVYRLITESTFEGWFAARQSGEANDRARIGISNTGVGSIQFGPGGATSPDTTISRAAAGVVSIQGHRLAGAGTSFPSVKSTNDVFYRTDLRMEFFWDGSRWLSTTAFVAPFAQSVLSVNGWSEEALAFRQIAGESIWIDQAYIYISVATTHSNTNKWVLKTYDQGTGDRVTLADSWASEPSVGGRGYVINQIGYLSGTGVSVIRMSIHCTKIGSPGTLDLWGGFRYRLVAS